HTDLVDGLERRARELELPAGLERDRGARAQERDERAVGRLALGQPAVALGERFEHGHHAALALVRQRRAGHRVDAELLGFGADAMAVHRLHRLVKGDEELVDRGERLRLGIARGRGAVVGHVSSLGYGPANVKPATVAVRWASGWRDRSLTSFAGGWGS